MGYPLDPDYLAPNGYYANSGYTWFLTSGVVVGYAPCTYTPTPTPTPTKPLSGYAIVTGTTWGSASASCATGTVSPNGNLYGLNGTTTPTVGQTLYTDSGLSIPFNGNNYYFQILKGTRYAVKFNTVGEILDVVAC